MAIGSAFNSGIFNKSLFTKETYMESIGKEVDGKFNNGYAVVRIKPKFKRVGFESKEDPEIIGVFNTDDGGEYSFDIECNWKELGNVYSEVFPDTFGAMRNFFEKKGKVGNLFGGSSGFDVYSSKKIYEKSGYLTLKIPMMVIDWNGSGMPLMTALLLSYYCLPDGNITKEIAEKSKEFLENQLENLQNSENRTVQMIGNVAGTLMNVGEGVYNFAEKKIQQGMDYVEGTGIEYAKANIVDGASDILTLRSSPTPVMVQIGKFFKNDDMIIESLNYSFSTEMTEKGPIFAKFDLKLSTRKILSNVNDIGLTQTRPERWSQTGNFQIA